MMVSRDGVFGILIGAAVGTLFLVPAYGSAQDSLTVLCSTDLASASVLTRVRCRVPENQFRIGSRYDNGDGVPEDDAEAVRWYRLAAEQGFAAAQYNLGWVYANGDGVPEDDAEAVRWYRLAAEQGLAEAQYNLGLMYSNGEGVREDDAEAVRWLRLAAEQGDAIAQVSLGLMYEGGEGVPEDLVYAYMWYNLSAAQGQEIAQSSKDGIEQRMTREQIAEAQRLSREWIETHPQDGGN